MKEEILKTFWLAGMLVNNIAIVAIFIGIRNDGFVRIIEGNAFILNLEYFVSIVLLAVTIYYILEFAKEVKDG